MPKSPAERKAAQRARQCNAGLQKVEVALDRQEVEMLRQNCAARRPGRDPYDIDEYLTMLIRKDNTELQAQLKEQAGRSCGKCGDQLPVSECCHSGDSQCWVTLGWHETKLMA